MPGSSATRRLRAAFRLAAVAAGTLTIYLLLVVGSFVLLPFRRLRLAWRDGQRRLWGRWMARSLGLRLTVRGQPPPPPFFLVSNHLSYLDILVLLGTAGGVFVAKSDLGSWPILGHLCRVSGTLLIDRGSKRDLLRVAGLIEARLGAGCGVLVFPEGTTGPGDRLLPLKPSLLEVAVRSGSPVWNATLSYRSPHGWPPPEESICWWRDMEFIPHLRALLQMPWVDATVDFSAAPIRGVDRKELAANLRLAMEERFVPSAGAVADREPGP